MVLLLLLLVDRFPDRSVTMCPDKSARTYLSRNAEMCPDRSVTMCPDKSATMYLARLPGKTVRLFPFKSVTV